MYEKLNSVEQTNKSIEPIANCVTQTISNVDHMNMRVDNHEKFLKLLAYKSSAEFYSVLSPFLVKYERYIPLDSEGNVLCPHVIKSFPSSPCNKL